MAGIKEGNTDEKHNPKRREIKKIDQEIRNDKTDREKVNWISIEINSVRKMGNNMWKREKKKEERKEKKNLRMDVKALERTQLEKSRFTN